MATLGSSHGADPMSADVPTRPRWLPEHIFPFLSRHAVVDGANVHYVDEGDGPVLLLMHGNPTYSFLYRELITGLQNTFRCIAIDYPGFGLSTAPPGYRFTLPSTLTSSRSWLSSST